MGYDSTCSMDGIGTVLIKMFDRRVRELKDLRCVPQIKKKLNSVGDLKAHGLEFTGTYGVFKVLKGL